MYTIRRRGRSAVSYRKSAPKSTVALTSRSPRKVGLVPTYGGWNPRSFTSRGGSEWKYVDVAFATAVNATGSITLLNGLAPGSSASQRIGMKVTIRSLEIHMTHQVTAATGVDQSHRFLIVQDSQSNGVGPAALTDFLTTNTTLAPRNLANRRRFRFLLDKSFYLSSSAESGSGGVHKFYLKLRTPIVTEFNSGVAGTIADIVTNSLHFVAVGDVAAGAAAGSAAVYCRIRYTDN